MKCEGGAIRDWLKYKNKNNYGLLKYLTNVKH